MEEEIHSQEYPTSSFSRPSVFHSSRLPRKKRKALQSCSQQLSISILSSEESLASGNLNFLHSFFFFLLLPLQKIEVYWIKGPIIMGFFSILGRCNKRASLRLFIRAKRSSAVRLVSACIPDCLSLFKQREIEKQDERGTKRRYTPQADLVLSFSPFERSEIWRRDIAINRSVSLHEVREVDFFSLLSMISLASIQIKQHVPEKQGRKKHIQQRQSYQCNRLIRHHRLCLRLPYLPLYLSMFITSPGRAKHTPLGKTQKRESDRSLLSGIQN